MKVNEHFVAFIDILGFSAKVGADFARSEIDENSNLGSIRQAVLTARALGDLQFKMGVQQFSDSIVLYVEYTKDGFLPFINACAKLQADLVKMRVLVRGGVTYGKHYAEDGFVYSQGLIDAYILESQEAVYPRIVLSQDMVELIYPDDNEIDRSDCVCCDKDRYCFVDFTKFLTHDECESIVSWAEERRAEMRGRIADKMAWLSGFVQLRLSHLKAAAEATA